MLEFGHLALDDVELLEIRERLAGDLALMAGVQIKEFPPRMGHAAGFGHALGNQRLVARVIVAYQRAAPLTQEALRMLAGTTFGEVIDDRLDRFEGANTVGLQVGAMRLAGAGIEHRHRRLIGMQDRMREHLVFQGINQRLQGHAHLTYPLGQGRLRDG